MDNFGKSVVASILGSFIGLMLASTVMFFMSFFLIGALIAISGSDKEQEAVMEDSVFVINIEGEFVEDVQPEDEWFETLFFGPEEKRYSVHNLRKALDKAAKNEKIKSVLLRFRNFNGGLATAQSLRRYLEKFRQSGKPVYSYSESYSQVEYYIASVSDKLYLHPQADFTLNGLAAIPGFFKRTLEYVGLKPQVFRVGKYKSAIEPFIQEQMSPEYRSQLKTLLTDVWDEVREEILRNREWLKDEIDSVPQNKVILTAEEAFKRGFFDGLRTIQQVTDELWPNTPQEDRHTVGVTNILAEDASADFLSAFSSEKGKVAVIFAEGDIGLGRSSDDRIGSDTISKRVRLAFDDEDIKAVVLRINSPGGSALASDIMWRQIEESQQKKKVPVIASFSDIAASGGYYMAAGADKIFAENLTITGSIGVFGLLFNSQKLMEDHLRMNFDKVTTHPHGDFASSLRPLNDFERNTIQQSVERTYERFLEVVKVGRPFDSRNAVHEIAQGQVYTGKRAKEIGLVDELGGLQNAIEEAAKLADIDDYDIKVMRGVPTPAEKIREAFGMQSELKELSKKLGLIQKVRFFLDHQGSLAWMPELKFQ